jgi:hypothetical protein
VRLTRLIRSSPADSDRIEWSRAQTREAKITWNKSRKLIASC